MRYRCILKEISTSRDKSLLSCANMHSVSSRVKSLQRGSLPGRGINRASIMGALKRSSLHKASGGPGQLERAANNLVGRPISEIEGDRFIEDNEARLRQLTVAEIPDDIPELRLIQSVK